MGARKGIAELANQWMGLLNRWYSLHVSLVPFRKRLISMESNWSSRPNCASAKNIKIHYLSKFKVHILIKLNVSIIVSTSPSPTQSFFTECLCTFSQTNSFAHIALHNGQMLLVCQSNMSEMDFPKKKKTLPRLTSAKGRHKPPHETGTFANTTLFDRPLPKPNIYLCVSPRRSYNSTSMYVHQQQQHPIV